MIGAGSVVTKDIPDNVVAFELLVWLKEKSMILTLKLMIMEKRLI